MGAGMGSQFGFNLKDLLIELRRVYDEKSAKKIDEVVEKYEPVRTQHSRKDWRKINSNDE